jgi:hypothetical protein
MNKITKLFILALVATSAFAQQVNRPSYAPLSNKTTLSAAVGVTDSQVCLASATGVVTRSVSAAGSYLFVDREVLQVGGAGSSSTCFRVTHGQLGTAASAHLSAARVYVGNAAPTSGDSSRPFTSGLFPLDAAFTDARTPALYPGSVGSTVTAVNGTTFYSMLHLTENVATSGGCLENVVGATDKYIFALYDKTGNLIANTALAGVVAAGSAINQCIAWDAGGPAGAVFLLSPGDYYFAIQTNGTTTTFLGYKTGTVPATYVTGSNTGTFGTLIVPLAPAVTFTTAVGPVGGLE